MSACYISASSIDRRIWNDLQSLEGILAEMNRNREAALRDGDQATGQAWLNEIEPTEARVKVLRTAQEAMTAAMKDDRT